MKALQILVVVLVGTAPLGPIIWSFNLWKIWYLFFFFWNNGKYDIFCFFIKESMISYSFYWKTLPMVQRRSLRFENNKLASYERKGKENTNLIKMSFQNKMQNIPKIKFTRWLISVMLLAQKLAEPESTGRGFLRNKCPGLATARAWTEY